MTWSDIDEQEKEIKTLNDRLSDKSQIKTRVIFERCTEK